MANRNDEALRLIDKLIAQDAASLAECEAMAARLGKDHETYNELLRDAAQYRQSVYRYGLIRDSLTPRPEPADMGDPLAAAAELLLTTGHKWDNGKWHPPTDRPEPAEAMGGEDTDFAHGVRFIIDRKHILRPYCAGPTETAVFDRTMEMLAALSRPEPAAAAGRDEMLSRMYASLRSIRYNAENGHQDRPLHHRLHLIAGEANRAIAVIDESLAARASTPEADR